ncbi:MAG: TonB-dependent receptor [Congregibacter sp.]
MFLEFSGQPTLEEALNQMPQVQPDFGRTSNSPGDGTARINLRGLGAERTLVMLNGRRLAPSGAGSAVDVNNLPQALIKRVEIITGGASAVYGSDAIAGVVNVITDDEFDGFSVDTSYYSTERGDSEVGDLNLVFGKNFGDGRGNITAFASYLDRNPSFAADRDITRVPLGEDLGGGLSPRGSGAIPEGLVVSPRVDLGNGPELTRFNEAGQLVPFVSPDDLYNFAPVNYLQTPLTRYSAGVFLNYQLNEDLEAYSELAFTRNESAQNLAPIPTGAFYVTNLDNPFFSDELREIASEQFVPVAPGLVGFAMRRRWEELGPRVLEQERDYARAVAGLRGAINSTWDFDVWLSYADGDESERLFNSASASRIDQALLVGPSTGQCFDPSGGCVPLDIYGPGNVSAEAADFIRFANIENVTEREQTLASAFITGAPLSSWAGPIDVALGIEWRSDSVEFRADDNLFTGDAIGFLGDSSISGEETVFEIYGEAVIPLLRDLPAIQSLDLEIGARYSDYENAGSVDTWKLGAQWQLTDSLRVRSIFQHSVRAPNLQEAFQQQVTTERNFVSNDTSRDVCSASANPAANGNAERCISQGIPADQIGVYEATPFSPVNFVSGGNPDLGPEEADTFTVGLVYTPAAIPGLDLAIDYFDLEVTDTVGSIDALSICFDPGNVNDAFCGNIRRDAQSFNVVEVFEPTSNRGITAVRGVDTQINYVADLPERLAVGGSAATLNLSLVWTYTLRNVVQDTPVSTKFDCVGVFGGPCGDSLGGATFPEDRVTANARYSAGPLDINLTWRWIGGTESGLPQVLPAFGIRDFTLAIPKVDATSYFDLGVGFAFSEAVSARLNVSNLTDEDPPLMADAVFSNNTDTRMYDVFGRSYQLALRLRF